MNFATGSGLNRIAVSKTAASQIAGNLDSPQIVCYALDIGLRLDYI